ncbi:MAG TPA: helix-turn-helix transcriptional regulator [Kineosporiaceae bacterium]
MPAGFWEHDQIRAALSSWHMGKVITAYRNHPLHGAPLTQEVVAGWTGITQGQLSRIERGPQPKDLERLIQWAQILRIPEELLWFRLPSRSPARTPWAIDAVQAAPPAPPVRSGPGCRRAATARGQPDPGLGQPDAGQAHAAAMQSFRAADRVVGGGHLYATVVRYLRVNVGPDLFGGSGEEDGSFAFAAGAALTEMAGWMAHDAGEDQLAWQHFTRSRDLATVGGDRQLLAHVYASMSHLAAHRGRPLDAVHLAVQGHQALAAGPCHPQLESRLLAMQARGRAGLGESQHSARLLIQSEDLLTTADDEPASPWVSPFDPGALANEAAKCLWRLRDIHQAEAQARRILHLRAGDRARSRAFGQILLVQALIAQQELEEACTLTSDVVDSTRNLSSHLVVEQLDDVREALTPYRSRSRAAGQLLPVLERELARRFDLRRAPDRRLPGDEA